MSIQYEKPEWRIWLENLWKTENDTKKREDAICALPQDQVDKWVEQEKECTTRNHATAKAANEELQAAKTKLIGLLPDGKGNVAKYLKNNVGMIYYSNPYDIRFSILEIREKRAKVERDRQQKEAAKVWQEKAVKYLLDHQKKLGVDFSLEDAVYKADELAADLEIERMKKEITGLIPFDGQNCEGECGGWDGHDSRCACGNRRVCWATSWGHSFESPSVHAEAH